MHKFSMALMASLVLLLGPIRSQNAGQLDLDWNGDGTRAFEPCEWSLLPRFALWADRLVTAERLPTPGQVQLTRFQSDGSLDASFDGDGIRVLHLPNDSIGAWALSPAPTGALYVLLHGTSTRILRLLPDGREDPGFPAPLLPPLFEARTLQCLPDGRLLVLGRNTLPAMACYLPDGTPDLAFGTNGVVEQFIQADWAVFDEAQPMPDGSILLRAIAENFGWNCDASIQRVMGIFSPDGHLGFNNFDQIFAWDFSTVFAAASDGGWLASRGAQLKKYDSQGNPAPGFGINGVLALPDPRTRVWDIVSEPDGRLRILTFTDTIATVHALLADGSPETTFSSGGSLDLAAVPGFRCGLETFLQSDGKLLLAGLQLLDAGPRFTPFAARYAYRHVALSAPQPDPMPDFQWLGHPNPSSAQTVHMTISAPRNCRAQWTCRDIAGRIVLPTQTGNLHAGTNAGIPLQGSEQLVPGTYLVEMMVGDQRYFWKMAVQ